MVIDLRRCIGCHSCSVACKVENKVPVGVFRSWVMMLEKGKYPYVSRSFLPSLCNHCNDPTCLTICPVKATWQREDGIVMIDEQRCIGCKYCIASCPYNARYLNPLSRVVQKCSFCYHRIDAGLEPACVDTCLGKARIFGDLADRYSYIARLIEDFPVQVLKPQNGTDPQVYYIAADMVAMAPIVGYTIYPKNAILFSNPRRASL